MGRHTTAIVTFSGFTEDIDEPTGTMRLYEEVISKYDADRVQTFTPRPWNQNPRKLARMIQRLGYEKVILVGYSWGAGWASQVFAMECHKIGLEIPLALLCDPVYRPSWIPGWMGAFPLSFRALFRWGVKIHISPSVRYVVWVRQNNSIPRGHDLVPKEWGRTLIEPATYLPYSHVKIDNAQEWHDIVDMSLTAQLNKY